jgi:RNA polymerase II subunit A small phosphatase-like protein
MAEGDSFWSCLCPCFKAKPEPAPQQHAAQQDDSGGMASVVHQVDEHKKAPPVEMPVMEKPRNDTYRRELLPPRAERKGPNGQHLKCLVLDLDETLVHSSFKPIPNADFVISLDLNQRIHKVYVRKRPGVDQFLTWCKDKFEVVIFTASLAKYAHPLLDELDGGIDSINFRLFREDCVLHEGNYVKDLSHLGRPLKDCIIVDNSPYSYAFQVNNSIPVTSWFNDDRDRQLFELQEYLERFRWMDDVVPELTESRLKWCSIPVDEHA